VYDMLKVDNYIRDNSSECYRRVKMPRKMLFRFLAGSSEVSVSASCVPPDTSDNFSDMPLLMRAESVDDDRGW